MEKFTKLSGIAAPMPLVNIDTDMIIPKQFLKSIKRTGFGPNLFDEWRYLDHGEPGMDNSQRPLNPDFVLNDPRYADASILLARELDVLELEDQIHSQVQQELDRSQREYFLREQMRVIQNELGEGDIYV